MSETLFDFNLSGLSDMGTEIGQFLSNIAPGIGKFLIYFAIFGGIAGVIGAVIYLIRKKMSV
jgi:hypothetical protein